MGMCVAGFGVFGVSIIYIMTKNVDIITGFSLGASSIAPVCTCRWWYLHKSC